jgi:hypothetical protein
MARPAPDCVGSRGPVTEKQTQQARAEVRLTIAFLAWLNGRGRDLAVCGQADIDAWYADAYTASRLTHGFLRWSMRDKFLVQMTIPNQNPKTWHSTNDRWGDSAEPGLLHQSLTLELVYPFVVADLPKHVRE